MTPSASHLSNPPARAPTKPLAFEALFENWPDPTLPDGHPDNLLRTATIITKAVVEWRLSQAAPRLYRETYSYRKREERR